MTWYSMIVGIEHLTTGLFFYDIESQNGIQFTFDTPSMFKVWSDAPFKSMWPAHQNNPRMEAQPDEKEPDTMRCSWSRAEYAAKRVATVLNDAWTIRDTEGNVLPAVISDALIRKFGAGPMPKIIRGYPYYYFTYAGMFHGIEPDGYIHT